MKSAATILILLSILSVAVFGFFMMQGENMHIFCAAALGGKSPCPSDGLLALANYHLNILKNFSMAIPAANLLVTLLLVGIMAFLSAIIAAWKSNGALGVPTPYRLKSLDLQTFSLTNKLNHWLSFHEMSPTAFSGA